LWSRSTAFRKRDTECSECTNIFDLFFKYDLIIKKKMSQLLGKPLPLGSVLPSSLIRPAPGGRSSSSKQSKLTSTQARNDGKTVSKGTLSSNPQRSRSSAGTYQQSRSSLAKPKSRTLVANKEVQLPKIIKKATRDTMHDFLSQAL